MKISALFVVFLLVASALFVVGTSRAQNPIYFSVEPVATSPLTDTNSSLNGLEIPATSSAVGQSFTVEIHLIGATVDNLPAGVGGVEVHLYFGNILTYAAVTGFTDFVGQTGGVLTSPVIAALGPGFFAANGTKITSAPYTGAVEFEESAASTGSGWNGADGLVAKITFKIIKQPNAGNGEPTVSFPLALDFQDLNDALANEVNHDSIPGTLTIDGAAVTPSQQYTLTVNVVGNGTVTWSPLNTTYTSGTVVTLTGVPGANWALQGWSGSLTGTQNPINITMTSNATVTATFVPQYTLTVNVVGNGTVTLNPLNAAYASGTVVTLTGVPGANWALQGWSGSLTGTQNPINITMTSNATVTATFIVPQYTLTVNVVGNGTVTWSPLNTTYTSGTVVTLTATPGANTTFQGWSGSLTGTQNPINITMTSNATVTATFAFSGAGIPGDLNHDGKVNLQDLVVFAKAWHTKTGDPNYNPDCDLAAPFGYISLPDLLTFAVNYGKSLH